MECVSEAFEYSEDPKKDYWINRIWRHFRDRFSHITKEEWITFLASLSDTQAYGPYFDHKSRECCIQVRNRARQILKDKRSKQNVLQVQTGGNIYSIFGSGSEGHQGSIGEDLELSVRFG